MSKWKFLTIHLKVPYNSCRTNRFASLNTPSSFSAPLIGPKKSKHIKKGREKWLRMSHKTDKRFVFPSFVRALASKKRTVSLKRNSVGSRSAAASHACSAVVCFISNKVDVQISAWRTELSIPIVNNFDNFDKFGNFWNFAIFFLFGNLKA